LGWWASLTRTRAEQWTYLDLSSPPAGEVEPESGYLSVFLRSAHVVDARRGLRRFYGTVSSSLSLPTRAGTTAQFASTISPAALQDVDPDHLDRFVQLNHRLLGPVPYVGGDVVAEVGLFSVASGDLTVPYLALLDSLSRTAGVAFIGVALPFAGPIRDGINLLSGASDGTALEIGFSTTWRPLRPGVVASVRTPSGGPGGYRIADGDGRLLDASGRLVTDVPYLVVETSVESRRDDWVLIPELASAWADVQREYRAGRPRLAADALTVFRRIALTCDDLLFDDALRIAERAEKLYGEAGPPTPAVRGTGSHRELPPLESLSPFGN
jgi:hypothetical protein